ncbi:MAG: LysR family transcriptional regulator [Gammaproteobacteria bacterium]|nr:MAG: LysR family transcriptional regulator [Gammaproteobacteria bacterium]
MSIRRLRTLVAVAEEGTFAGAAQTVFVSQAAVSMQMKSLEQEVGASLFDRKKRPPALNPLGLALVSRAREILHAYDEMLRSVSDTGGVAGELTIGAVPTTMTGLVPKAVSGLRAAYPMLHIKVVPDLSAGLLPQVDRGHLDAAIVSEPQYPISQLRWIPFAAEPLIVLAAMDATHDDPRTLLEESPFIRFNRQAWVGRLIDDWLRKQHIHVREVMELDTLEAISSMVYHGLGISIVPHRCVPSPSPLPLKRIPLAAADHARILGIIMRPDCPNRRLVEVFIEELVHQVREAGQVRVLVSANP